MWRLKIKGRTRILGRGPLIHGHHPAEVRTVLLAEEGEGWIIPSPGAEKVYLSAPEIIAWEPGDWFECGTEGGQIAVIYFAEKPE